MPADRFGQARDGTPIPGRIRSSARARRVSVIVHADRVDLVVPEGMPLDGPRGALAFLASRLDWVRRTWDRQRAKAAREPPAAGAPVPLDHGATVLDRGEPLVLTLRESDVARPRVERVAAPRPDDPPGSPPRPGAPEEGTPSPVPGGRLVVTLPRGLTDDGRRRSVAIAVRTWALSRLLAEARRLAADFAARLDRPFADVRLTRARTRWGSCAANGVIRINATLAAAPPDVLEYLVAHEVTHLRWRGHGPRFHAALERLLPDYLDRRRRLRAFEKRHPAGSETTPRATR